MGQEKNRNTNRNWWKWWYRWCKFFESNRIPAHGGAGGGCIILVSPTIDIKASGTVSVAGRKGGNNSGTSHFASGGGGGGGGGFLGLCCENSNLDAHHPYQGVGMKDLNQTSVHTERKAWGPYSTGDLSIGRQT